MTGPNRFASQPLHAEHALLDGTRLDGDFRHTMRKLAGGASSFLKWDGSTDLQVPMVDEALPINMRARGWDFPQRAADEAEWRLFGDLAAEVRSVYWVPYNVEPDGYVLSSGTNDLKLSRDRAAAVVTAFEDGTYLTTATLDGVDQTIVTGSPSAGEVRIYNDRDVQVTNASGGERLVVRYYPAYAVYVVLGGETFDAYNSLVRDVSLIEARTIS